MYLNFLLRSELQNPAIELKIKKNSNNNDWNYFKYTLKYFLWYKINQFFKLVFFRYYSKKSYYDQLSCRNTKIYKVFVFIQNFHILMVWSKEPETIYLLSFITASLITLSKSPYKIFLFFSKRFHILIVLSIEKETIYSSSLVN